MATSDYITIHNGLHRQLRAYLLGVLDTRLGNLESAEHWVQPLVEQARARVTALSPSPTSAP